MDGPDQPVCMVVCFVECMYKVQVARPTSFNRLAYPSLFVIIIFYPGNSNYLQVSPTQWQIKSLYLSLTNYLYLFFYQTT